MNKIDTSQLLNQLRSAAVQAKGGNAAGAVESAETTGVKFSSMLSQSIDKVNTMQQESGQLSKAFEVGDPNVSLPQVMLARNKASLAFEGMVQVRNKVVEAYQEIMRMPV